QGVLVLIHHQLNIVGLLDCCMG
ncbi:hypothetical protein CFC21_005468, partial [Triticum aestivum]